MFEIANPWIFLLLPLPWILWSFVKEKKSHQPAALRVPFYQAMQNLPSSAGLSQKSFFKHFWCLLLIWALLVSAASGPQLIGHAVNIQRSGRDIMLAIDISESMQTPDMEINHQQVDRLQAIKEIASNFIKARKGDRIGLILFGSNAYLQTPLTYDHDTAISMLDDASIGLAGPQTAIGDAIGLAIKRLIDYPATDRVLVLLTDGVSNAGHVSVSSAIKMAVKNHIKIYTIGFGADSVMVESFLGPQMVNPSADLDEATLKQIAAATKGVYFRAKDTSALQKVYDTLNKIEPIVNDKATFRPTTPLYVWPLAIAFLLSILLFTWPLLSTLMRRHPS